MIGGEFPAVPGYETRSRQTAASMRNLVGYCRKEKDFAGWMACLKSMANL
jgi:hypothetical protein